MIDARAHDRKPHRDVDRVAERDELHRDRGLIVIHRDDEIEVGSSFITYRTKDGVTDTYFGSHRYRLVTDNGTLRIREKRCLLDSDGLRTQGRVSIIL